MRTLSVLLATAFFCFFCMGCNKEKVEEKEASIKIYGTITAYGEPVPDCTVEISHSPGSVYSSAISGSDGTYEVEFVPKDINIDVSGASIYVSVSVYGERLVTRYLTGIAPGSSLHCDFDITSYL